MAQMPKIVEQGIIVVRKKGDEGYIVYEKRDIEVPSSWEEATKGKLEETIEKMTKNRVPK